MGLLSRKRKVPRIVKKVKGKTNRKKISLKQIDPRVRVSLKIELTSIETLGPKQVSAGEYGTDRSQN